MGRCIITGIEQVPGLLDLLHQGRLGNLPYNRVLVQQLRTALHETDQALEARSDEVPVFSCAKPGIVVNIGHQSGQCIASFAHILAGMLKNVIGGGGK